MSTAGFIDSRLTRRQMLWTGGAACACSILGRQAKAQGIPNLSGCVEVERWYGNALAGRPVDRAGLLKQKVNDISARTPAALRAPSSGGGAAFAPSMQHPAFSGMPPADRSTVNAQRIMSTIDGIQSGRAAQSIRVQEGIMKFTALWDRGSQVSFRFMMPGAFPAGEQAIRDAIDTWKPLCGLNIVEATSGPANVRITFATGAGHYSMIGTESSGSPQRTQFNESLNIDPNGVGGSAEFLHGVALHEFGHAIGFMHEHQNPSDPIQWNRDAVIQYFSGPPNNWDNQTIQENIFQVLNDPSNYVYTNNRDPLSIMHYWYPRNLYTLGPGAVPVPDQPINELSDVDKRFCAERYGQQVPTGVGGTDPGTSKPVVIVTDRQKLKIADAKALVAGTPDDGEFPTDPPLKLYKVEATTADDYVLETLNGPLLQTDGTFLGGMQTANWMPVVLELFDGTDFTEDKAIAVSTFGDRGSIGAQDAYLKYKLEKAKTYYVVARPQQRPKSGAKTSFKLLLRQAGASRTGLVGKSWSDITKEIRDLQADIQDVQASTKTVLGKLRVK